MQTPVLSSGKRLDRLPISPFHRRLLALIGAGLFLDGFDLYIAGGIIGFLVKTGWANLHSAAGFISATAGGMLVGTFLAGWLGDWLGRRFTYQFNLLIFGLGSLAAALVYSMDQLILARFIMGLGMGAEVVVAYGTLIEYIPPQHRGRWGSVLSFCGNVALPVATLGSFFVIPSIGWRWLFIFVAVAALIVWYLRKAIPESPRWLESKGRHQKAHEILCTIEQESGATAPVEALPLTALSTANVEAYGPGVSIVARAAVGISISVAVNAALYGFIIWLPTFFIKAGVSVGHSLAYTLFMSTGGPLGALVGAYLADRVQRKWSIVTVSLFAAALGVAYPFCVDRILFIAVGFLLIGSLYAFLALAYGSYLPELFPTSSRLRWTGLCGVIGKLAALGMPFAVVRLFQSYQVFGVVGALALILAVQALIVGLFGRRTNSHSLETLAVTAQDGGRS